MKVTQSHLPQKTPYPTVESPRVKQIRNLIRTAKKFGAGRAQQARRCASTAKTLGTKVYRPIKAINRGIKDGFYGRARARVWGQQRHTAARVDAAMRATLNSGTRTLSPSAMRAWLRAGSAAERLTLHKIDKHKPGVSQVPLTRQLESYKHGDLVRLRATLKATCESPKALHAMAGPRGTAQYVGTVALMSRTVRAVDTELNARASMFRQIVETHAMAGQNILSEQEHAQQLSIQTATAARLVHGRGTAPEKEARSLLKDMSASDLLALNAVFDAAAPQPVKPGAAYRIKTAVGLQDWNKEDERRAVEVSALADHVRAVTGERLIANTRPAFVEGVLRGENAEAAAASALKHALDDDSAAIAA